MASRVTFETILRDEGDASGQTIRQWIIYADRGHVTIKLNIGEGFILLRAADVGAFVADLQAAKAAALTAGDGT